MGNWVRNARAGEGRCHVSLVVIDIYTDTGGVSSSWIWGYPALRDGRTLSYIPDRNLHCTENI